MVIDTVVMFTIGTVARAASMAVWTPWPLQPHSVSQNSPIQSPSQTQEPAAQLPWRSPSMQSLKPARVVS